MEAGRAGSAQVGAAWDGTADCCGTLCLHACHMTAVADAAPRGFAIAPVARLTAEAPDRGLALFRHGIDHVPLA